MKLLVKDVVSSKGCKNFSRKDFQEKAMTFALMSDGSTDASTLEEEILYIQYAHKEQVFVKFVGIKDVPKADAKNISTAISYILKNVLHLDPDNWKPILSSVCSDGAAVMMGKDQGVVTVLTDGKSDIIVVHCFGHRLELAFKDLVKSIKLHSDLSSLLITIFTFYRKSGLNKANLKKAFLTLQMTPVYPKRIGGNTLASTFL